MLSLILRIKELCPLSVLLFNIILIILTTVIIQEDKMYTDWKGRNKLFSSADGTILYVENPKLTKKSPQTKK